MHKALSIAALSLALVCTAPAPAVGEEPHYKVTAPDGAVPIEWSLAKPAAEPHEDGPSGVQLIGTTVSRTNGITFTYFESGDMVVVGGIGSPLGHAGLFDGAYYTAGISSYAIWSANTAPVNGVQRERCAKYRNYDKAWALWVPRYYDHRFQARSYCRAQVGEPYDLSSTKTDQTRWYCSKLCWAAWRYTAGADLDADGGWWVAPIDLVNDRDTSVFGYWT
jgi:hypothetical protein